MQYEKMGFDKRYAWNMTYKDLRINGMRTNSEILDLMG
jgi:hypothetical protein